MSKDSQSDLAVACLKISKDKHKIQQEAVHFKVKILLSSATVPLIKSHPLGLRKLILHFAVFSAVCQIHVPNNYYRSSFESTGG